MGLFECVMRNYNNWRDDDVTNVESQKQLICEVFIMLQKNCENEIRELSRDQQEMLDEHIDRLNKVFKGKDNYAGIAVMPEKYAPVVRENKEAYPLNEIQVIIKKNGEPFVRCSWKSDEGTSSFPLQFSAKTSKSGQISGSVFVRGQMESPIVIDSSDEFELDGFYELMVHACDEEMGYLWVGDGKNEGLTRMDYLLSGNLNRNPIEKLIDQMYFQNATSEGTNHE